jgi:V/A-type H+-transporting ATPase subunit F
VLTHKIAAVGEEDIVLGFKALGIEIYPVDDPEATVSVVNQLMNSPDYGIILVSESLADKVEALMSEIGPRPLPSLVYIPGSKGSQGFAMQRIRKIIERAVGADILSEKR